MKRSLIITKETHTILKDRMRWKEKLSVKLVEKVFDRNIWVLLISLKKFFLKFWVSNESELYDEVAYPTLGTVMF